LEPLSRAFLAVLLSLLSARVSREKSALAQLGPKLRINEQKRPRNAQANRARLSMDTAAVGEYLQIEFTCRFGSGKRLLNLLAQRLGPEIALERPPVDRHLTFTRLQNNPRD
jgi:hypothetical protein